MRRTHGALSTGTALVGLSSNCSEFENPTVCSWKIVKLPAPNAWSNSPRLQPKQRASIFNSPRSVTATPDCPHPPCSALRKSKLSPPSAQVSKATQSANAIRICSRASRRQAGSSPGWEDGTATINPLVPSPCDVAWNSSTQSIAVANSVNPGRCCNEKCESPSTGRGSNPLDRFERFQVTFPFSFPGLLLSQGRSDQTPDHYNAPFRGRQLEFSAAVRLLRPANGPIHASASAQQRPWRGGLSRRRTWRHAYVLVPGCRACARRSVGDRTRGRRRAALARARDFTERSAVRAEGPCIRRLCSAATSQPVRTSGKG